MPDPLLGDEQLVGEWNAGTGLLLVTGWVAGPAGSAVIELPGAELDIDIAAPARTCQLLVPAPASGDGATVPEATRAVLRRLLGDPRAVALLNLVRGHRGRPVVLPAGHDERAAADFTRAAPDNAGLESSLPLAAVAGGGGGGVDPRLARLGLARLAVTHDDLSPIARAVAQLEAALMAADLPADLGLVPAVAADLRAGAEALLDLAAEVAGLDPVTAFRLAALVRRAADVGGTDPAVAKALRGFAAGLDLAPSAGFPARALAPAATTDRPPEASGPLPADEPSALPPRPMAADAGPSEIPAPELDAASARRVLPGDAWPVIARPSQHEIEVTLPALGDAVEGVWARVLRRVDGVLVALAPLRAVGAAGADAQARLLVPDEPSADLLVDLTLDPAAPAPSRALLAFEEALAAGRWAARAQRLGQRGTAIVRWRDCAEAWTAAGDDRRAAMATEYAELVLVEAVPPTTEPLVSDRLTKV